MCVNTELFIDTYKDFYYSDWYEHRTQRERLRLGIPNNLKSANRNAETWIDEGPYHLGLFNEYALAWKSGKLIWNDNNTIGFKNNFETEDSYINSYGGLINIYEFEAYSRELEGMHLNNNNNLENFEELYDSLVRISPRSFGPVYIIASLFFESVGAYPIYDKFVHIAVKALALGINPADVYLGTNPDKHEIDKVVRMYKEYTLLLRLLFPNEIGDHPYIPRNLDRALWVYGHCTEQWNNRLNEE